METAYQEVSYKKKMNLCLSVLSGPQIFFIPSASSLNVK